MLSCFAGTLPAEVTYSRHIAPLLNQHCIGCHRPEGSAPFSLLGYASARKRARLMADVTEDRYMPPWKPAHGYGPSLVNARVLTADAILLLRAWADAGAPPGELADVEPPPPAPTGGWTLGTPDLVLESPEAYSLAPGGPDVFRNFVLPLPLTRPRYVRAVEFMPLPRTAIHHAVFALDPTSGSRARDAATPGPGFDSMDLGQAINPNGHIIGWTPGQIPYEVHPGTAWEVKPGTDLIVQLHLLPTGKPESVRPRIGLYFTDEPPTVASTVIQLREYTIDIPAGAADHIIEEKFDLPVSTRVLGLYPHAHYLGKDLRVFAELPGGGIQPLIRIPDWDFKWQSDYRYAEPLRLPAGSRIVMRYSYDNSAANPRNPSAPPRRVKAGWGSADEMGEVAIQLLLDQPADRLRLDEAQARYDIASGAASAASWYNLGLALDYQQRGEEAVPAYEEALRMDPQLARAANNLGALMETRRQPERAASLYRRALASDSGLTVARYNLSRLLARQKNPTEANTQLQALLQTNPEHLGARLLLADLQAAANNHQGARATLTAGLPGHASDAALRLRLGKLLAMSGDTAAARGHLEAAVRHPAHTDDAIDPVRTTETHAEAHYTLAVLAENAGDLAATKHHLALALAAKPTHADTLLMSAALALFSREPVVAVHHLTNLLKLPAGERPDPAAIRAVLPFPSGPASLGRALVATGNAVAARQLLGQAAAEARRQGRPDWANDLENQAVESGLR